MFSFIRDRNTNCIEDGRLVLLILHDRIADCIEDGLLVLLEIHDRITDRIEDRISWAIANGIVRIIPFVVKHRSFQGSRLTSEHFQAGNFVAITLSRSN